MNTKEIKEILKLVSELDLREVKIKDKEFELRIRTEKDKPAQIVGPANVMASPVANPVMAPAPAPSAPLAEKSEKEDAEASESNNYVEIKSPMVGTFYRSASPDKPPYIQVGDNIGKGDVVCIIEAMKLFNEIESEVSGKIVKVMADDSTPVEYDQALFLIDPSA